MNLTKNFTLEELTSSPTAKRLNISNTPNADQLENLFKLAGVLQKIRDTFGMPIIVNSAFRCERLNKAVGGATNSDHKYGCASDIQTVGNLYNKALWNVITRMADRGEIELRQIIDEYNLSWIHISINSRNNEYKKNQIVHVK